MTDTTAVTYKAGEKGLLESVIAKLFTLGEGTDQGIMDQVLQSGSEMVMGDIGKAAAGAVSNPMKFNLFEGVDPAPEQRSAEYSAANPLASMDPGDAGVDISGIMALGGANWKELIK